MSAQPTTNKVLRIGVFQKERCIEERLVRKKGPVTIGQTLSNTFVVPASSMPKSYVLFDARPDGSYSLRVNDRMGGRLSLGNNDVIDLTRVKNAKEAKKNKDGYEIPLTQKSRGKVTIGDTRILFQFVSPPASSVGMLPSAMGGGALAGFSTFLSAGIVLALAISAVVQLAPLFAVMLQDWPEPEDYQTAPPDWYLEDKVYVEDEEEPEEEDQEEEEDDGESEIVEEEPIVEAPPEKKETQEEEKSESVDLDTTPAKTPEEKRLRKEQGKKLVTEALGVTEGGESVGDAVVRDILGDSSPMSALDGLDASQIGGSSGKSAGLGLGDVGGADGEPGLKGTEGGEGGSERIIGSGPKTEKPKERKEVKYKIKEDTKLPPKLDPSDKKGFEKEFRKRRKQVENCYKRVIQKYGDQRGKLVVTITIGSDGKVLKVKVNVDEIKKGLGACVEAKIKRWDFPDVGKPVSVSKRWVFG